MEFSGNRISSQDCKTTQPQRAWFTQTLLSKRNNIFPEAVRRRACKCLSASSCATSTLLPPPGLFYGGLEREKERLSAPRKSLSDKRCFQMGFLWDQWRERAYGEGKHFPHFLMGKEKVCSKRLWEGTQRSSATVLPFHFDILIFKNLIFWYLKIRACPTFVALVEACKLYSAVTWAPVSVQNC